jgi:GNAT superfamily N-acetyltransferase
MPITPPGELLVERADLADAGEILTLTRAAFVDEAQAYGDPFILPLTESVEQVRTQLDTDTLVLKAVLGGRIVGAVRGRAEEGTFLVNRLVVAPDQRRRGIGRRLMSALEAEALRIHPDLVKFALFTGENSGGNQALYRSLGYTLSGRQRASDHVTLVYMRKDVAA